MTKCLENTSTYKLCEGLLETSSLFDITVILGSYCSKKSLKTFKDINCQYKKIAEQKCELYLGLDKGKEECPFHFTNKNEVKDLHKSFFGKQCKKLKWSPPNCI